MLVGMAAVTVLLPALAWSKEIKGLHLPKDRQVNLSSFAMTDGGGYQWQIQNCGNVYQGTNWAYSSGMYFQVSGNNVYSSDSTGWSNKEGDEIEIGPMGISNLQCYRRIKVYKDKPLARWIEIIQNPTSRDITVQAQMYSSFNYGINNSIVTSSGEGTFGEKDFAFITDPRYRGNNTPSVLHIVRGPKARKFPVNLNISGSSMYVQYNGLTIPAGETVLVVSFEVQHRSKQSLEEFMKSFDPRDHLKDLPLRVRRMIINFDADFGFGGVELDRAADADVVRLVNGVDVFRGKVTNESFTVRTFHGDIEVKAKDVIGMAAVGAEDHAMLTALSDGQVFYGTLPDQRLKIRITGGSILRIPFDKITQWSYRISEDRPDEIAFHGPYMVMRTGDRLAFDPESVRLQFRTRYGLIDLLPEHLLNLRLDNKGNTVHRVQYLNGSHMGGFLQPREIDVKLRVGNTQVKIQRGLLAAIEFAQEEKPDPSLTYAMLTNGDELFGQLDESDIQLITDYGDATIKPGSVQFIRFSEAHLKRAVIKMWGDKGEEGSTLRGQLGRDSVEFKVAGGPNLELFPNQCVAIVRSHTLPQTKVMDRVGDLVAMLGAESSVDREKATEELKDLGPGVLKVLEKFYSKSRDPEVRNRLEHVIEHIKAKESSSSTPTPEEVIQWIDR